MSSVLCTNSNPDVIKWSRTSLNIDRERAATVAGIDVDHLDQIEAGTSPPTLSQLRSLAGLYKTPIATFFLPASPSDVAEPRDFRTRSGPLSRETLLSIRRARAVQNFIRHFEVPNEQVFWPQNDNPQQAAHLAREWLGLTDEIQLGSRDASHFFRWLTTKLEDKRIELLVHKFPQDDAKAYCFAELPQIVVVSSNDNFIGSRIFSVLHELGHLSLGDSGLCLTQESHSSYRQERYCDKFAVNLLMPEKLIRRLANDRAGVDLANAVDEISDQVKSSKTSLLIRFQELDLITNIDFEEKMAELRQRTPTKGRGASSRVSNLLKDSGYRLPFLVFEAYRSQKVGPVSAAKMLNVSPAYLDQVGSKLGLL
jgi:Zn-dependent peptidase ImmA (M78 family)